MKIINTVQVISFMVLFTCKSLVSQTSDFKSYSKFDFVPGDQIIYFEDFSDAAIGDFPARWNTTSSGEIVTINNIPGKWLKTVNDAKYKPAIKTTGFPENYTIEFDAIFKAGVDEEIGSTYQSFTIDLYPSSTEQKFGFEGEGMAARFLMVESGHFQAYNWKDSEPVLDNSTDKPVFVINDGKVFHVSIWIQKQRGRLYIDQTKLFDLPFFLPDESKLNAISFWSSIQSETEENYLSNIRIAIGAPDLRNKLLTDGKLVTHGILFDVNSDKIKSESYGTLKGIADVLKENTTVKVKIVGYTDSDGDDKSNLDLSKRRAAAVKAMLTQEFGIDGSRMETDGKGESDPVSVNTTSEGKANNRRVEFIKL